MHWKRLGQLGHTHGESVDFIYWYQHFFLVHLFLFPPFPGPTMVEKPHSGGGGWDLLGQPKAFRALLDGQ